jgi:hypothetical protein
MMWFMSGKPAKSEPDYQITNVPPAGTEIVAARYMLRFFGLPLIDTLQKSPLDF